MTEVRKVDAPELLELLARCRRTPVDHPAWERLFNRFSHAVRLRVNATARTLPVQDRDDLCQKVWMELPRRIKNYNSELSTFVHFLDMVTTRAVRTEWRRRRQDREFTQNVDELIWEVLSQSPEEQDARLLKIIVRDYLTRTVKGQDRRQKLAIYEDWIEGKTYQEIMKKHRVSKATVFRCFKECRKLVHWAIGVKEKSKLPETKHPPGE